MINYYQLMSLKSMKFEFENHMHECVAMVKYFAKAPHTFLWKKGARVKGEH